MLNAGEPKSPPLRPRHLLGAPRFAVFETCDAGLSIPHLSQSPSRSLRTKSLAQHRHSTQNAQSRDSECNSPDFVNHLLFLSGALVMSEKALRWFLPPLLGGLSFWLPDTATHLILNVQFDRRDVIVVTVLMPLCLCAQRG